MMKSYERPAPSRTPPLHERSQPPPRLRRHARPFINKRQFKPSMTC
jgi:hypothetical protein